ncbi:MAG: VWA domain-containing protein [Clostridia bacterium]|nr:VWA domain-containing protein [Clostridia bacterium]
MTLSFLYPLGLLGLIGIPILIIIYIIKNKYTEQTVSSTYIWTYSEKFLKKRKKLPKIAGLISLILQLLLVAIISVLIAQPRFTFEGAANDYLFVLDASGSMGAKTEDGDTRFDDAKDEIKKIIEESENGSLYTLIYVGDSYTYDVYTLTSDKEHALSALDGLSVTYGSADTSDALELAKSHFAENPGVLTYFVTDTNYTIKDNVNVINVAGTGENFALNSPSFSFVANDGGGALSIMANAVSYGSAKDVTVDLFIDNASEPTKSQSIYLPGGGEEVAVKFDLNAAGFSSFRLVIGEQDIIASDNEIMLYNPASENAYSIFIASDTPFFISTAIKVMTGADATVVSTDELEKMEAQGNHPKGYGLYVFDSCTPETLPDDGTVWFFNLQGSVTGANFHPQGEVMPDEAVALQLSKDDSKLATQLKEGLTGKDIYVESYMKYGFNNVTEIYSYQMQPLVFALENTYGNRQVVFAFSLHDSNFPLLSDFAVLMSSIVDYSFPEVVEKTNYVSGETLEINIPANCSNILIKKPNATEAETVLTSAAANEFVLNEPGTDLISLTIGSDKDAITRNYRVYAELASSESEINRTDASFSVPGNATNEGRDGIYDDIIIFVIVLAVLFAADWMVYCYDKYQLR